MHCRHEVRAEALNAYIHSPDTASVIAANFGVSLSSLTVWAKSKGVPLRERGRKRADAPSGKAVERLELLASGMTLEEVGAATGCTKQCVSALAKRWPDKLAELKRQHRQGLRGHSEATGMATPVEAVPPQIEPETHTCSNMNLENYTASTSAPDSPAANMPNADVREIPVSEIDLANAIQTRHAINKEKAGEYAERMLAGDKFPPLQLFDVEGVLVLTDGGHRRVGAELAGMSTLLCTITKGTREDAVRAAMVANTVHGLPRTNRDKRHAAQVALKELSHMSARAIADLLKVAHTFVQNLRDQLESNSSQSTEKKTGRDGRKRPSRKPTKPADKSDHADGGEHKPGSAREDTDRNDDHGDSEESDSHTSNRETAEPPAVWPEIKQMLDERIKPPGRSVRPAGKLRAVIVSLSHAQAGRPRSAILDHSQLAAYNIAAMTAANNPVVRLKHYRPDDCDPKENHAHGVPGGVSSPQCAFTGCLFTVVSQRHLAP